MASGVRQNESMNPYLLMPLFAAALIGACVGFVTGYSTRTRGLRRVSRKVISVLAALSWITFTGGLIYWHIFVEPRLDGSEGAGIGFGWVLIHVGASSLALMFTGVALGLRLFINLFPETHKANKPCVATGDRAHG